MHKWPWFIAAICLSACNLLAQENLRSRVEVFGGYQFSRIDGYNGNGWNVSSAVNLNRWLGVAADLSGTYKHENFLGPLCPGPICSGSAVDVKNSTYMFGPVLSYRSHGRATPFVHALFGGDHLSGTASGFGSAPANGFAMALGGGTDVKLNRRWAVRLFQVDWLYLRFSGTGESSNARVSTGLVLRF